MYFRLIHPIELYDYICLVVGCGYAFAYECYVQLSYLSNKKVLQTKYKPLTDRSYGNYMTYL